VGGGDEQVDPAGAVLDHECRVQALQGHGVDVEEVDREETVGLGAQERTPGVAATGGGGIRRLRRIRRIVEAATRCLSRRNSPWTLTTSIAAR
jgi:hypothetical protein